MIDCGICCNLFLYLQMNVFVVAHFLGDYYKVLIQTSISLGNMEEMIFLTSNVFNHLLLGFDPIQNYRKSVRFALQLLQFFVRLLQSFYPKFRQCFDSIRYKTIGNRKSVRFAPQLWPSVATWRHFAFDRLKTDEGRLIQGKILDSGWNSRQRIGQFSAHQGRTHCCRRFCHRRSSKQRSVRELVNKKNGLIWEYFPSVGPPTPFLRTPVYKKLNMVYFSF